MRALKIKSYLFCSLSILLDTTELPHINGGIKRATKNYLNSSLNECGSSQRNIGQRR